MSGEPPGMPMKELLGLPARDMPLQYETVPLYHEQLLDYVESMRSSPEEVNHAADPLGYFGDSLLSPKLNLNHASRSPRMEIHDATSSPARRIPYSTDVPDRWDFPGKDIPKLVGIAGLIGAGKSTLAEALTIHGDYRPVSFATPLKSTVAAAYGWDFHMLLGDSTESRKWRETVDPVWGITPRQALQRVGVAFREGDPDHWVKLARKHITEAMGNGVSCVIADVRFPNELEMIRELGGVVVQVRRDEMPEWWDDAARVNEMVRTHADPVEATRRAVEAMSAWGVHESEWRLAGETFDAIIENPSATSSVDTPTAPWRHSLITAAQKVSMMALRRSLDARDPE